MDPGEPSSPPRTSWWVNCTREEFDQHVAELLPVWKVEKKPDSNLSDSLRQSWDLGMTRARKIIWYGR